MLGARHAAEEIALHSRLELDALRFLFHSTRAPEDAKVLADAEREIAEVPGRLASQPSELEDGAFVAMIRKLATSETGIYLVAEVDGVIVGHALLEPRELAVTAHVVSVTLAVHEGFQGKGYGRALMKELIDHSRQNPRVEKIELHVRSSNQKAIALYESLGFVEQGRKPKHIKLGPNDYLDDVYMALWIGTYAADRLTATSAPSHEPA